MTKKAKRERITLGVLLTIAAIVWLYSYRNPSAVAGAGFSPAMSYKPMGVENPRIHWEVVGDARATEYLGTGRDIFNHELPPPPPPPVVTVPKPGDSDYVAPAPPPPPPLQLPLKFLGYGTAASSSQRRAFLTDGDTVFVVSEGEAVMGHFRIVKIGTHTLEFEDVASGRHGTAAIEEQGPTS